MTLGRRWRSDKFWNPQPATFDNSLSQRTDDRSCPNERHKIACFAFCSVIRKTVCRRWSKLRSHWSLDGSHISTPFSMSRSKSRWKIRWPKFMHEMTFSYWHRVLSLRGPSFARLRSGHLVKVNHEVNQAIGQSRARIPWLTPWLTLTRCTKDRTLQFLDSEFPIETLLTAGRQKRAAIYATVSST